MSLSEMEREEERQRKAKKKNQETEQDKETFNEALEAIRRMKGKFLSFILKLIQFFIHTFFDFRPIS